MTLRQPLWLLLLVPAIAVFVHSLRGRPLVPLSPLRRAKEAYSSWRTRLWWLPEFLSFAFFAVSVFLIAGPQKPLDPDEETTDGLAIVLALDRSSSMSAIIPYGSDRIRRIDGVKIVTRDFFANRPRDQFAIVSFARYPETNTPLTANKSVLADFLSLIDVPNRPEDDGTAIGDALVLSVARLPDANGESADGSVGDGETAAKKKGVVILLTDGQSNAGAKSPAEGAEIAARSGATVYTIALGGEGYVVQNTAFGPQAVGVPIQVDEETLSSIARKTGGKYYRADSLSDLSGFYADIAKRETTKLSGIGERKSELELGVGIAILLAILFASTVVRHYALRRREP